MVWRRKIIIVAAILSLVVGIFAQGVAITLVMEKLSRNIDERFFAGRFYWKPKLPPLYKPAKAGFVSECGDSLRFSPPFHPICGGK